MKKTITVVAEKKGTKYWTVALLGTTNSFSAKVVINEATAKWKAGDQVTLEAAEISTRTKYGTTLMFDPICGSNIRKYEAAEKLEEARKVLKEALEDAAKGFHNTPAQKKALELCPGFPGAEKALAKLNAAIKAAEDKWNVKAKEESAKVEEPTTAKEAPAQVISTKRFLDRSGVFQVGSRTKLDGKAIVITEMGPRFRYCDDDHGCCHPDMDGVTVRYYYYKEEA